VRSPRVPIELRFWPKVNKNGPILRPELGPCWVWTASIKGNGYGKIGAGGAGSGWLHAHRVSWKLANGPIPDGLQVLHRCDNRPCVRPDHLFLGTALDNQADCVAKGRKRLGSRVVGSKITEADVIDIRSLHAFGATHAALGAAYGVSDSVPRSIIKGTTWAWLR
jgi:hypothetical protein